METTEALRNTYRLEAIIEAAATGDFGVYNPVSLVECPHCGGSMQAIDAKVHVRNMTPDDDAYWATYRNGEGE